MRSFPRIVLSRAKRNKALKLMSDVDHRLLTGIYIQKEFIAHALESHSGTEQYHPAITIPLPHFDASTPSLEAHLKNYYFVLNSISMERVPHKALLPPLGGQLSSTIQLHDKSN